MTITNFKTYSNLSCLEELVETMVKIDPESRHLDQDCLFLS
jgi:hypothetical protein